MRSDSKIPPIWTIINGRKYIWWLESVRLKEKKWIKHWFWSKNDRNRFYEIYNWIKRRCKGTAWWDASKWYFDKWIKCEWNTFEEFKNDMYEAYLDHVEKYWIKNTSIDRIDPNGNYCKENRATIKALQIMWW